MPRRTIAIANQKGGVGKTTTTVNLAYAFLAAGMTVLAIDLDPQASLSISLGLDPKEIKQLEGDGRTTYFSLISGSAIDRMIVRNSGNGRPDLVPSSIRLASAEAEMVGLEGATHLLRERLAEIPTHYDVILIDCPPTLGLLTVNGLTAADDVLVPAKTDLLSIMGVPLLLDTISNIQRRANPDLNIIGILPTHFHPRNSHDKEVLAELSAKMVPQRVRVFEPIHHAAAFDKAIAHGKSALELWPNTPGVQSYRQIVAYFTSYEEQI